MRIIAGEWRGRKLLAPPGQSTRPTADRTRETLFSMLTSRLGSFEGLRVADLYAGSGALGFEALSRGAAHVTFVENDATAVQAIRINAAALKAVDRVELRQLSTARLAPSQPFDLIFADPPYGENAGNAVVCAVEQAGWLAAGGWLAVETAKKDRIDAGSFVIDVERPVGRAQLTLLRA